MKAKLISVLMALAVVSTAAAQTVLVPVNFAATLNLDSPTVKENGYITEAPPEKYALTSKGILNRLGVYRSDAYLALAVVESDPAKSYFCVVAGGDVETITNNMTFAFLSSVDCGSVRSGKMDLFTGLAAGQTIQFPATIVFRDGMVTEFEMRGLFVLKANDKADQTGKFFDEALSVSVTSAVGGGVYVGRNFTMTAKINGKTNVRLPLL